MKNIYSIALVALAIASVPRAMRAQQTPPPPPANWILDNFEIGAGRVTSVSSVKNVTLPSTPNTDSDLIGGSRYIALSVTSASNPYQQPVQVQVRPSASASDPSSLLWSIGYGAIARIDLEYGLDPTPLNLDLTGYDRFRVNFSGLIGPLNFNIAVAQGSNGNIGASCGINLGASGFNADVTAFTVDFPLSNFGANAGGPVQWSDITVIDIIFQGASNLAITKFLAIPIGSTEAPATFTCGASAS
jgi:hypothetical protein